LIAIKTGKERNEGIRIQKSGFRIKDIQKLKYSGFKSQNSEYFSLKPEI